MTYNTSLIGIDEFRHYISYPAFLNIAKQGRRFRTDRKALSNNNNKTTFYFPDNSNHYDYFTSIPDGVNYVSSLFVWNNMPENMVQEYVCTFEGDVDEGDVYTSLTAKMVEGSFKSENGLNSFEFDVTRLGHWELCIDKIKNSDDHPRNFTIYPKNDESWKDLLFSGEIIHPELIRHYNLYNPSIVRFMMAMDTNNSNVVEPEDYRFVESAVWTEKTPLKVLCEIANKTNAIPRFHIPHMASDKFILYMAGEINDNLDGDVVELAYSNETWNSDFKQHDWILKKSIEDWGWKETIDIYKYGTHASYKLNTTNLVEINKIKTNFRGKVLVIGDEIRQIRNVYFKKDHLGKPIELIMRLSHAYKGETGLQEVLVGKYWHHDYYTKLSYEKIETFKSGWCGDKSSIIPVLEGHISNVGTNNRRLKAKNWKIRENKTWIDPQTYFKKFDIAAYFGSGLLKNVKTDKKIQKAFTSFEAMTSYLTNPDSEKGLAKLINDLQNFEDKVEYKIPIGLYEGGNHLLHANEKDKTLVDFLIEYMETDLYASVLDDHYNICKDFGYGPYSIFSVISNPTAYGDWGIHREYGDNFPRAKVLQNYLKK